MHVIVRYYNFLIYPDGVLFNKIKNKAKLCKNVHFVSYSKNNSFYILINYKYKS